MIDLTLIPEVLNPLSVTQTVTTKVTTGGNKAIWILVFSLIITLVVIGYLKYRENKKGKITEWE